MDLVNTSCTKKKSSPASRLLTAFGLDSVLSLHVPISVSGGKAAFIFLGSSLGLPAQLAPIWNVYGRGDVVACICGIEEFE
jgi:hypothetical protein